MTRYGWAITAPDHPEDDRDLRVIDDWRDFWLEIERELLDRLATGLLDAESYAESVEWLTGCDADADPLHDGYAELHEWYRITLHAGPDEVLRIALDPIQDVRRTADDREEITK